VIEVFFVVEGQSEEKFITNVLVEHLAGKGVYSRGVKLVGRGRGRGGMTSYARLRDDLNLLMRQHNTVYITTMIDVFRVPNDFPGYEGASKLNNPLDRADALERAILEDFGTRSDTRFLMPYLQLHEFEALLWTDPEILDSQITQGAASRLTELQTVLGQYETPEHINNGALTAPSKRLEALYGRAYDKVRYASSVAQAIGLERLREACPRFGAWVTRLEGLG
jgi:Domain of unknown function (DUF4276)